MISLNYISGTLNSEVSAPNGMFDLIVNNFPVHVMYNDKAMEEPPQYHFVGENEIIFPNCSANFRFHRDRIQMFCTPNGSTKMSILISEFHKFGFLPNARRTQFFDAKGMAVITEGVSPNLFSINRTKMTMANFSIPKTIALSISKLDSHPVRASIGNALHTFDPNNNCWVKKKNTKRSAA